MNPLLNNYEDIVLNQFSKVTFNPSNFGKYNRRLRGFELPELKESDKNIHEFDPTTVNEPIKINRRYINGGGLQRLPVSMKSREMVEEKPVPKPPPIPKNIPKNIPQIQEYKESTPLRTKHIVKKPVKPILIKKLDTIKRKKDRRVLLNCKHYNSEKQVVKSGEYLAFPFSNNEDQPMYIHSIDLKVSVTNTNIRGTLYYTDKNPALKKFTFDKKDWIDVRHSIRFFSYDSAVLKKEGAVIHIELKEIMIEEKAGDFYFIFEIDGDKDTDNVTFFTGPKPAKLKNTLTYDKKMWKALMSKTIYYVIYGRQWRKAEKEKIESIQNDTSEYETMNMTMTVDESRYYYFMVKTLYTAQLSINGKELIKSNRCKKGSKCSHKLDVGEEYSISLTFSKSDPGNYFGWTNKYNKNWIDDLSNTKVINFKFI